MKFKDQLNNTIELQATPKRIICLVPSITELLVDLGLRDCIVGITKFCMHPANLRKEKKIVGGTKNINFDKIKSLNPDFIICNKEENTKTIVSQCKSITATYVSNIFTIKDTLDLIKDFGIIFFCTEKATDVSQRIENAHLGFLKFMRNKQSKNVAYFIWKNPWMVAANHTFIHHLLELNNFKNIYGTKNRSPEIDIENLKDFNDLEYIFLSSEPYPFNDKHIKELKSKTTGTKVILVNGEYFSWYGSRLLKAFDYFKLLQNTINKE